ncbi:MAG: 16S rRNA (adenine(1518)-N(6)/adenine(1519)-N(6))-dimethyltransferase RsmA [Candidatus Latescibacterota bacterium]
MSVAAGPRRSRPRKRFGQHFLVDRVAIGGIVGLVQPMPGEVVVEVGPGRGALTGPLLAALPRLVAVEVDRDLVALLRERFPQPHLRLVEADILRLDLGAVRREERAEKLLVVGNLPYNITAPLLFRLLEQAAHIRGAVVTVQREVARRLTARPGSRDYGLTTVLLGMQADISVRLEIGRQAFRPVPAVEATVLELRFLKEWRHVVRHPEAFGRLVRAAFGQRRKMLHNSLAGLLGGAPETTLEAAAAQAQVDLRRRAESLSVEEFARLSEALAERQADG